MRFFAVALAILLCCGFTRGGVGLPHTAVYFSPTGTGGGPGTISAPYQTAAQAQTAARAQIATGATDVTVIARGNTVANAHVTFTGVIAPTGAAQPGTGTLTASAVTGSIQGGDMVSCGSCTANTIVIGFISGVGGSGTYLVSPSQTVSSTAMSGYQPVLYTQASTLAFTSADQAPNGHTSTWKCNTGEYCGLSGGVDVTGTFSACTDAGTPCGGGSNGVYKSTSVSLPADFREAYFGGIHGTRARGAANPAGWSGSWNGTSVVYTTPTDMSGWGNKTSIELVAYTEYQSERCLFASFSSSTGTLQNPCGSTWHSYTSANFPAAVRWIENAAELLVGCGAGCWYHDVTSGALYYIPRPGENMATLSVVVPNLENLVTATGTLNLTFSHMAFRHTGWLYPTNGAGNGGFMGQGTGYVCLPSGAGCVFLTAPNQGQGIQVSGGASNVLFDHDLFMNSSTRAVAFLSGSRGGGVTNSIIADHGGGGIQFGDYTNPTTTGLSQTANGVLRNNLIPDAEFEYFESTLVFLGYCAGCTVDHSELDNAGWTPLQYNTGSFAANYGVNFTLSNNAIGHACSLFPDCGAFYTNGISGSGSTTPGNSIHTVIDPPSGFGNHSRCFQFDEGSQGTTSSGSVCDTATTFVQVTDSGSHGITVTGNYTTTTSVIDNDSNTISGNTTVSSGCGGNSGCLAVIAAAGVSTGSQAGIIPGP